MPNQFDDPFKVLRRAMVSEQIEARGIKDKLVIDAMLKMPRHLFVPKSAHELAYKDQPIALGPGQSISQPYIVAHMLESLQLQTSDKVLDVGTGSGYQTALLAEIVSSVCTIEIDADLSQHSQKILKQLAYSNIQFKIGDGKAGWQSKSPFDVIIVSAACESVPRDLVRQLSVNGRMILPLGNDPQFLVLFHKTTDGLESHEMGGVQFVMIKDQNET